MQRLDGPDANDTFLADLEKDGFSHVALKKLDKKSLINQLLHNQIVREERILGQSTEKPAIVEALDLTLRTIKKRIKRYRNLVIFVLIVTGVSVLLAVCKITRSDHSPVTSMLLFSSSSHRKES